MIFRTIVSVAIALVLSLLIVPVASAHSTQPRVEISVERLNPGGVVNVRGVSFGMDDTVTLTLLGTGVEIRLGEIIADGEGEFLQIVVLPTDLVEGIYYIRATTSHHWVISPPLTIWGAAVVEGGGQGPRDEDDSLLAPMPTYPPAAQVGSTASSFVSSAPVEAVPVITWNPTIVFLVAVVIIVVVVMLRLGRKRSE